MNTVFSHIVQRRYSHDYENIATDALAFILESSEPARSGLMKLLRGIVPDLPSLRFRTQQTEDNARPDMWGFDGIVPRAFVENKFWAGLTENQPVHYLKLLAGNIQPSLLLVVVPAARQETVWRELLRRLENDKSGGTTKGKVRLIATGIGPILALTSWRELLSAIDAELADDPQARNDVIQLRALCDAADSHEVRAFNVFAPAVLCGIGALPGTLHDRSIIVRLERAKPGELCQRFDSRHVEQETELCRKLARWCADNLARLGACDPVLPSSAFNRLADNWRPLFTIAQVAGGDWPQRAAEAFAKLTAKTDADAQGIGTMLLADIQRVFIEASAERMLSKTLVDTLCSMSDRPWPEANRGRPITPTWMARRLHCFNVSSKTIRVGDERANGYELAHFQDAFDRYLPTRSHEDCGKSFLMLKNSAVTARSTAPCTIEFNCRKNAGVC
ncbi:MAG: DUF3631 domain-containing protein [Verrucomicrobiia bacterium]